MIGSPLACADKQSTPPTISETSRTLFARGGRRRGGDLPIFRPHALFPLRVRLRQLLAPVAVPRITSASLLFQFIERSALDAVAVAKEWLVGFDLIEPRPDRR